ncbi:hypothetical protein JCM10450v2_006536 [Rhodotorula kratochvilovae]
MHAADGLLSQLEEICTWFPSESPPTRTSSSRGRVARAAETPRDSASAFRENWDELLPSERERAVDKLLAAFCELCTSPSVDVQSISYANISEAIGATGPLASRRTQAHEGAYGRVGEAVEGIVALYQGGSLYSIHTFSRAKEVSTWAKAFLSAAGFSREKAMRMDVKGVEALAGALELRQKGLEESGASGFPLPSPRNLPNVDVCIARAEVVAHSPADRMAALRRLLGDFTKLYSPANHFQQSASTSKRSREANTVSSAAAMLRGATPLRHFARLSPAQQYRVVKNARTELFAVCEALRENRGLPDASMIVQTLFHPISHPELHEEPESHGEVRPLFLESLAHTATALRQISDRKAQRYYGTTARAWQARRAAGGL